MAPSSPFFETGSHHVGQDALERVEIEILLPQAPQSWDYGYPPQSALGYFLYSEKWINKSLMIPSLCALKR